MTDTGLAVDRVIILVCPVETVTGADVDCAVLVVGVVVDDRSEDDLVVSVC